MQEGNLYLDPEVLDQAVLDLEVLGPALGIPTVTESQLNRVIELANYLD
jgi:hypothetical protein